MAFIVCLSGCQIAAHKPRQPQAESISALTTMTKGLTNKPISEDQLKRLKIQAANDPQTQTALRSINSALSPRQTVKYCPVDGERFSADMIDCPIHHVKLKWVE